MLCVKQSGRSMALYLFARCTLDGFFLFLFYFLLDTLESMFVSFWDKIILWRLANVAVLWCRGSIARSAVRLCSHPWLCLLKRS